MFEIEELKDRIQALEEKIVRQNRVLVDIPRDRFSDFVCGTTDVKRGIKKGEGMFRFKMINADDLRREVARKVVMEDMYKAGA